MLAVNAPGTCQIESANQKNGRNFASDNATNPEELLRYIRYYKEYYGKPVGISDVTMANGCDNGFMNRAMQHHTFDRIAALGGWNTAENTNGVVIAVLAIAAFYQDWTDFPELKKKADTFLLRALTADWLCQANVLRQFLDEYAPTHQIEPYFLREKEESREYFLRCLRSLMQEKLGGRLKGQKAILENIRFNWNGAFYYAVDVSLKE